MKVFAEIPPGLSKAMERVLAALKNHAPKGVEFVLTREESNLEILHVIGYPETEEAVTRAMNSGREYIIIQYCMRSTQRPNTRDWRDIWTNAQMVWSYYDLHALIDQDRMEGDEPFTFHFHCSPLGADQIFRETKPIATKLYTILTSGFVAESETVLEVAKAIEKIDGRQFHLGPHNVVDAWRTGYGLSDFQLADVYSRCCWVAGLRRAEGFEMPAAEGLCTGARPLMFDAPHYRRWFNSFADFIPETDFDGTVQAIVDTFERGYRPVTEEERQLAIKIFDWKEIMAGFWEGALS